MFQLVRELGVVNPCRAPAPLFVGAEERAEVIARAATLIGASPALQAREREIVARYTQTLARLLAEETGVDTRFVRATASLIGSP